MMQISNRGAIGAADQGQPKTSLTISDDLLDCMVSLLSVPPPLLGVPPNREHCWTMDLRKCRRHVLSSVSNTFQYLESGSVWFWSPRKVLLFRCGIGCIEICFTLQLLHSSPQAADLAQHCTGCKAECDFYHPKTSDASCTLNPQQSGFTIKLHARRQGKK